MLSSRNPRRSWARDARQQDGYSSVFRMLAGHWRPVAAQLREADAAADARVRHKSATPRRTSLPTCWSPWLLVK
jgi:hypothetical protein